MSSHRAALSGHRAAGVLIEAEPELVGERLPDELEDVEHDVDAVRVGPAYKDPSVTLNVYADAVPDDDGRAVETFSRAVWGA